MTNAPNHALQRTAPCVTAPASAAVFPPTMQVPRRTPLSLSLGSLAHVRRPCEETPSVQIQEPRFHTNPVSNTEIEGGIPFYALQ